jgi:CRISPR system Cascade subunit CasB
MAQQPTYRFLNQASCDGLLAWRRRLEGNRGERARLRRAESPDDVLLADAFFNFLQEMPEKWSEPRNLPSSSLVAAVLAHANATTKDHKEAASFAAQLATPKDGSDKPRMSQLRFRQLQKSYDPTEFFRRLLRAVRMLDGNVNILSLANDILHWMHEFEKGVYRKPQDRLAFCWANDYYRTLLKRQQN